MMQVIKVTPAGVSSETPFDDDWLLNSPGDGDGLRYQQRFSLRLQTGGLAEELLVDEDTSLRLRARHLLWNALDPSAPEQADVTEADVAETDSSGLLVTLPIPRIIHSIRFAGDHSPAGKTTQLFRTDGEMVAEEPVATYYNAVSITEKVYSSGGHAMGKIGATGSSAVPQIAGKTQLLAAEGSGPELPTGELGVTDGRILVRLRGTTPETLSTSSITEFNLSTGPENLRVGLRLPELGPEMFFLPVTFEIEQDVDLGVSLRNQLNGAVQRLTEGLRAASTNPAPPSTLPDPLDLELVVESDAPCRFTVSAFKLCYGLARESFPDGASKHVLRFSSDQPQRQRLGIAFPAPANLTKASVTIAGARDAESDSGGAPQPSSPLDALIAAATDKGLRIDPSSHWVSPLTVDAPMLSDSVDLLVTALSPSTRLRLEITRDLEGLPAGERLASAELDLLSSGQKVPTRFHLDTRILLQPDSYWFRLLSRDGVAVWYLQTSPGKRALQANSKWITESGIDDQTGIARWVPSIGSATAAPPVPEIALSGQTLAAVPGDKGWSYDLAPALGGLSGSGLIMQELEIFSAQRGPVTVYPPRIEFEI